MRTRGKRSRLPLYALLALLAAAAIVAGVLGLAGSKHQAPSGAATGTAVALQAVGSYDPRSDGGDGAEHNTGLHSVPEATDRNPSTYWTTDIYNSTTFGGLKPGVGLVVDAGGPGALKRLTVTTDTPGFTAKILAGNSPSGGFVTDSAAQTVQGRTTFSLHGLRGRYYVVWLTSLPPGNVAHVNELSATS